MAVANLFSKRKAAELGQIPALQSEHLPDKFRRQVAHLFVDAIGKWVESPNGMNDMQCASNNAWRAVLQTISQEHGWFPKDPRFHPPVRQCLDYLLSASTDTALDMMEVGLRVIDRGIRNVPENQRLVQEEATLDADQAIEDFNVRCRENGVGYSYADGYIVPVSSTYVHSQVVEPALSLLHQEEFRGAQEEFLQAHKHLRAGDAKNAIVEANKAFESVMKTICTRKGWAYDPGATARALIHTLLRNGYVPAHLETQLGHLRGLLETGVPVLRNKEPAHGQGPEPVEVPRELAEYAVHLTATNIVFLVKLLKA